MTAGGHQKITRTLAGGPDAGATMVAAQPQLTPTQVKVMEGVHSGLLNKQIAFDLGIAEKTVKAHMTALMRKLNVSNRTQVAILAQTMGYSRRMAG